MFNRKITIGLAKDDKKAKDTPVPEAKTPIDYVAIATEIGKKIVIGTCVVIATYAISNAAGQIAVNNFNPANKND